MPFYEYECSACSHHVEVLQKISEAHLRKCPDCGKSALKRLISAPVFRLKGAGWYETDFKSDNEQKRNIAGGEEAEAKADDKAAGKDGKDGKDAKDVATEGKSDSKADAAKSEPKPEATSERKSVARPVKTASPPPKPAPKPAPGKSKPAAKAKSKAKAKPAKKKGGRR